MHILHMCINLYEIIATVNCTLLIQLEVTSTLQYGTSIWDYIYRTSFHVDMKHVFLSYFGMFSSILTFNSLEKENICFLRLKARFPLLGPAVPYIFPPKEMNVKFEESTPKCTRKI